MKIKIRSVDTILKEIQEEIDELNENLEDVEHQAAAAEQAAYEARHKAEDAKDLSSSIEELLLELDEAFVDLEDKENKRLLETLRTIANDEGNGDNFEWAQMIARTALEHDRWGGERLGVHETALKGKENKS